MRKSSYINVVNINNRFYFLYRRNFMNILPFILHYVYSYNFQLHPGAELEDVGNTKFIHSYLDLRLDLSCSYTLYNQLVYLNISLNSIQSYLNNTYHVKNLSFNTSTTSINFSKTENINIIAKFSTNQQNQFFLQSKFASNIKFKLTLLFKDPWVINHRPKHSRSKRGLLDLGGKILNSLFGVATDSDLKKLSKEIELLSDEFSNNSHFRDQLHANTAALDLAF